MTWRKNLSVTGLPELRIKKNVSEYQMSLDLGKNKSYIQSISSGRSLPTMENFLEICEYLEVTPLPVLRYSSSQSSSIRKSG